MSNKGRQTQTNYPIKAKSQSTVWRIPNSVIGYKEWIKSTSGNLLRPPIIYKQPTKNANLENVMIRDIDNVHDTRKNDNNKEKQKREKEDRGVLFRVESSNPRLVDWDLVYIRYARDGIKISDE